MHRSPWTSAVGTKAHFINGVIIQSDFKNIQKMVIFEIEVNHSSRRVVV